jgi:hypothetical protein
MSAHHAIDENVENEKSDEKLGIFVKPKKKDDLVEQVLSSVSNAIDSIGNKILSKYKKVTRCAITIALVNKSTSNKRMLCNISKYIKLNPKTLIRDAKRRESIEKDPINHFWIFSGRLPKSDMKLTNEIKYLNKKYWHDNTRVSPNIRDVLKLRVGSKIREPHPKHLLDMTQTELYKIFLDNSILPFNISISQRSFEKCKPWYTLELINNESLVVVRLMYNFVIIMIVIYIYVLLCMLTKLCKTFVVLICHLKQSHIL